VFLPVMAATVFIVFELILSDLHRNYVDAFLERNRSNPIPSINAPKVAGSETLLVGSC
jgi:hypothetical protein